MVEQCSLLAVSPMGKVEEDDDTDVGDYLTANFNAEAHLNFYSEILQFYKVKLSEWCICFVVDNPSTNIRIAKLAGIPYVGCNSHKLHLEVNVLVESHPDMRQNIDSVRDVMREAKTRLKNATVLRNITRLKPKLDNDTRWSGKYEVLRRFELMRNDSVEASQHSDCNLTVHDSSLSFKKVGNILEC